MEMVFQECVTEVKNSGKTVFLSSHILSEVEALCDRVSIIRQGQIVESGALHELRHLTRTTVSVTTEHEAKGVNEVPGIHDVVQDGRKYRFSADSEAMTEILRFLLPLGVKSLTVEPPSLEELFMRHYGDDTGAKVAKRYEA